MFWLLRHPTSIDQYEASPLNGQVVWWSVRSRRSMLTSSMGK